MQTAVAKATRHNRETPPTGQNPNSRAEPMGNRVEPRTAGRSPQQQGEAHSSRAEPTAEGTGVDLRGPTAGGLDC